VSTSYSLEELAASVQTWCDEHRVRPANGQAAEAITERTIRYYRTLGLLDAPLGGYLKTFAEKHRLQLLAIRLYQAQGLPLRKIREELYGRSEADLRALVRPSGKPRLLPMPDPFAAAADVERWSVARLTQDCLLVSRRGRPLPPGLVQKLSEVLDTAFPQPCADHDQNQGTP
jgi:DNA-binding transcriptional MerR regulator